MTAEPHRETVERHVPYWWFLTLAGTLCGIEMGLSLAGVPSSRGGVAAALDYLSA